MLSTARSEPTADNADAGGPQSTSRSLLLPLASAQWSPPLTRRLPPDPTFVAQLIANAERPAHGHSLSSESAAGALAAYRARQHSRCNTGLLTRQTI